MSGRRPAGAWIFRCSASRSDHFQCKHQEYPLPLERRAIVAARIVLERPSFLRQGRCPSGILSLPCEPITNRPFWPTSRKNCEVDYPCPYASHGNQGKTLLGPFTRIGADRFLRCRLRGQPIYAAGSVFPGTKKTITPHKLGQSPVNGNHYCGARGRSPVISSRSRANNTW